MKILIIGKRGQLGAHLMRKDFDGEVISFGREGIDLSEVRHIYDWIVSTKVDIIINAAAYTDTKASEDNIALANTINGSAVGEIAKAAKHLNALFIHVSTDYVFDGTQNTPYFEDDITNPISEYGKSKLLGEQLALANNEKTLIIRTSWVFSEQGNNFVKTILSAAQKMEKLEIVADQVGSPTYAGHLADIITAISNSYERHKKIPYGIYHYSDTPGCSWFDFAREIVNQAKAKGFPIVTKDINPVLAKDWPSKVNRPQYAILDSKKIVNQFGVKQYSWLVGLNKVLDDLRGK